jgi:methylenetetrahydrofolate reductase (NADPH)
MKLSEIYRSNEKVLSFEVFPPKYDNPIDTVYSTIGDLKELNPAFISVTYGAGGSSKGRTVEIASKIKNEFAIESMAHLTCVNHKKEDIDSILEELTQAKVENILALRGDPPNGQLDFDYNKNDFKYADELISYIKSKNLFSIAAAAYPEGHKDCRRISEDLMHLKNKVDAGIDVLITQLFFDNRIFYNFVESAERIGINCPIIPGVMPVYNEKQIKRIITLCGASMPADMLIMVEKYSDSPEDLKKAGIEYTIKRIQDLVDSGAHGIHLEPMNRSEIAKEILAAVNI